MNVIRPYRAELVMCEEVQYICGTYMYLHDACKNYETHYLPPSAPIALGLVRRHKVPVHLWLLKLLCGYSTTPITPTNDVLSNLHCLFRTIPYCLLNFLLMLLLICQSFTLQQLHDQAAGSPKMLYVDRGAICDSSFKKAHIFFVYQSHFFLEHSLCFRYKMTTIIV